MHLLYCQTLSVKPKFRRFCNLEASIQLLCSSRFSRFWRTSSSSSLENFIERLHEVTIEHNSRIYVSIQIASQPQYPRSWLGQILGVKTGFMGVLKLSVIEEQNKQLKNKMRVVRAKDKSVRISNCYCPCECFIREGEVTMCDEVASAGSWNID